MLDEIKKGKKFQSFLGELNRETVNFSTEFPGDAPRFNVQKSFFCLKVLKDSTTLQLQILYYSEKLAFGTQFSQPIFELPVFGIRPLKFRAFGHPNFRSMNSGVSNEILTI